MPRSPGNGLARLQPPVHPCGGPPDRPPCEWGGGPWLNGLDSAGALFRLLQGLILGAFGWLYGSHGADRAERVAMEARRGKETVAARMVETEEGVAELVREIEFAGVALAAASKVPEAKERIDEAIAQLGERADDV